MNNINYEKLKKRGMEPTLNKKFDQLPDEATLTPQDIALLLNLSKETIRRWCRTGKLPAYSWGGKYAVCSSDFKEFMRNSKKLTKLQKQVFFK
jgi:excisionase family DNA binding protein